MGLKDAMINLVGDFVQMNRNPEFRSKNELNKAGTSGNGSSLGVPNGGERRHSLSITVGAEGPPETFVRNRTYSVCGGEHISNPLAKSPNSSHKKSLKNRRSSAPCILKEPPTFQLRRNRKTSESNDTENTEISAPSAERPRKPIIKKQKSEDFPASDSSDDSEYSSSGDYHGRRMKQNSPRLGNSGFFKNGSFRGENIIEEEPEEGGQSPCIKTNNVTIIKTRF